MIKLNASQLRATEPTEEQIKSVKKRTLFIILDKCDAIVELPMFGVNKSLNVMVSLGIILYQVISQTYPQV